MVLRTWYPGPNRQKTLEFSGSSIVFFGEDAVRKYFGLSNANADFTSNLILHDSTDSRLPAQNVSLEALLC